MRPATLILPVLLLLISPGIAHAQSTTAFKTGEETTGMTKICYYEALGNPYAITVGSVELCPMSIRVNLPPNSSREPERPTAPSPPRPSTTTAFKTGEREEGMTKICYYEALGSAYTRTVASYQICPMSIQVRR
jgi:hypothetical protein